MIGTTVGVVIGVVVFGGLWKREPEPEDSPVVGGGAAPTRSVPVVRFSQRYPSAQPLASSRLAPSQYRQADPRKTDGREKKAGARLHEEVRPKCPDEKCMYSECSDRCTQWVQKTYTPEEMKVERHRQQLFFNCVGFCIDPSGETPK